jgi:hypothetical protein
MSYQSRWNATDQVPQRAIDAAQADHGTIAEVVELDAVRRSSLARPLSDYAAVVAEVG